MFPSSNINNPFDYSLFKRPSSFPSDQNPSQVQDHDPPFLFTNFPSPFFDEHESPFNQILFQNQPHDQIITDHNNSTDNNPTKKNSKKSNLESSTSMRRRNNQLGVVPRRRAGKKDRHSKICTAQGIRDRRMRLSLQIARKFFDLQDMLGYDKASKTIEWLFTQSKKAINELNNNINNSNTSDAKSESFVSECEVVSGNEEMSTIPPAEDEKTVLPFNPDGEKLKKSREAARDKARARARSRTREKVMMKTLEISGEGCYKPNPICNNDNLDQKLGFLSSPLEEIRVSPNYEQQLADVGTIEKLLGDSICPTTSSAPFSGPNLDPSNNFMRFMGNWDSLLAGNPNYTIYSATPKFQGFHQ